MWGGADFVKGMADIKCVVCWDFIEGIGAEIFGFNMCFGGNYVDKLCVEIYGLNVWFCWDFVDGLYAGI